MIIPLNLITNINECYEGRLCHGLVINVPMDKLLLVLDMIMIRLDVLSYSVFCLFTSLVLLDGSARTARRWLKESRCFIQTHKVELFIIFHGINYEFDYLQMLHYIEEE